MAQAVVAPRGGPGRTSSPTSEALSPLPTWPFSLMFVGFPLWWLLGVLDIAWIPMAAAMALLMFRRGSLVVPRGFGWWLTFLAGSAASVVMLVEAPDLIGFVYRLLLYVAGGVLFVYVFNARQTLTSRYVTGCLTAWFAVTTIGGYLGLLFPNAVIRTPVSFLTPQSLLSNDLVNAMVIRRLAQYNPDSFLQVAPRPSAPFLYTNNWGNVYSLLLPFVIAYLYEIRGERRWWLVAALIPASAVPAFLTLNRGMFFGLALAAAYIAIRALLAGDVRRFAAVLGIGLAGVMLFSALPVEERLGNRLSDAAAATSNDTRASLYQQSLERVGESPILGFGAPQESENPDTAPVGTQGQVWMLLVSHGPATTACWIVWFLIALVRSLRRRDATGLASSTVLLVGSVEFFYYGLVPNGLPILMIAAALGMRGPDEPTAPTTPDPVAARRRGRP